MPRGIPIFIADFISILRDEEAREFWEWLDATPDADEKMVAHIAKTHKPLAKRLTRNPGKIAKQVV